MFGFLKRRGVEADNTKAAVGVPNSGVIPPLGSIPTATGLQVSQATAMTVSTVYRCVNIIARDVARCRPKLVRRGKGGEEIVVGPDEHHIARLLVKPNRVQTWFGFIQQMTAARKLRGNGFAAILRPDGYEPAELIPINPDAVMMLEAADGSLFYNTNRLGLFQIAVLRGLPISIPAEDVLHFRELSFNMLLGASPIGLGRDEIALAMSQTQQASRFAGSGARPSGILKSPKLLTAEAAARLKTSWNQFVSGLQNVGTTAVLEDGLEFQPLQLTSVDLQFDAARERQVYEIARYFGVPPYKLGVREEGSKLDPSKADQAYVNEVIAPELDLMEAQIEDTFGLGAEGLEIQFDTSRLLRADVSTRYNAYRVAVLTGIMTPNEARRSEGLPPMPGGDNLMVPANTAALGSDMTGTAPDAAGRPDAGTVADPGVATTGDQPTASAVKE